MEWLRRLFGQKDYTSADCAKEVKRGGKAFAEKHANDLWALQSARRFSGLPKLSLGRCSDDKEFGKVVRAAIEETEKKLISDLMAKKKATVRDDPIVMVGGQIHDVEEQQCVLKVNILRYIRGHLDDFGI